MLVAETEVGRAVVSVEGREVVRIVEVGGTLIDEIEIVGTGAMRIRSVRRRFDGKKSSERRKLIGRERKKKKERGLTAGRGRADGGEGSRDDIRGRRDGETAGGAGGGDGRGRNWWSYTRRSGARRLRVSWELRDESAQLSLRLEGPSLRREVRSS